MSGNVSLDYSQFLDVIERFPGSGGLLERVANDVIHASGPAVHERINPLIHPSGRTFRGHSASATSSDWPRYDTGENLALSVGTKAKFRYLYFPDDGSNTVNHYGDQQFMRRGAELALPGIAERITESFVAHFERS